MTHRDAFLGACEASAERDGRFLDKSEIRACTGCGRDFEVQRPWQKQCSVRCRQRAYLERKSATPIGYYGA